jgi:hypothetical protein
MAERFPTSEETQDFINAIIASRTAKTPASRLNYLQDWSGSVGFDPFGVPFQEDPFPEELYTPQTRSIYATDERSPYAAIFDAVDAGIDPVEAVRLAINDPSQPFGDPATVRSERLDKDIFKVARDYANELQTFEREQAKWNREQAKLRAAAPVTLDELINPASRYDELSVRMGRPEGLTVDDMLEAYNRDRFNRAQVARQAGLERRATKEKAKPSSKTSEIPSPRFSLAPVGTSAMSPPRGSFTPTAAAPGKMSPSPKSTQTQLKLKDFRVGPTGSVADLIYRDAARRSLEAKKQTPVWSPQAQQVLSNIGLIGLLTGQGD